MNVTCVVLAAGIAQRFGSNKLLAETGGTTLLERAVRACGSFDAVVVAGCAVAALADTFKVAVVINDRPELGMARSLQLANERIDARRAIAVLPADLALVEPHHVERVLRAAAGADVTYPQRADGTPGHPVVFSARARSGIAALPSGDTLRQLRDRRDFVRRVLRIEEPWPYLDVDWPADVDRVRDVTPKAYRG